MAGITYILCALLILQPSLAVAAPLEERQPQLPKSDPRLKKQGERIKQAGEKIDQLEDQASGLQGQLGTVQSELAFNQKSQEFLAALENEILKKSAEWNGQVPKPELLGIQIAASETERSQPKPRNTLEKFGEVMENMESVLDRSIQLAEKYDSAESGKPVGFEMVPRVPSQKEKAKEGMFKPELFKNADERAINKAREIVAKEVLPDAVQGSAEMLARYIITNKPAVPPAAKPVPPREGGVEVALATFTSGGEGVEAHPAGLEKPAPDTRINEAPPEPQPFIPAAKEVKAFVGELKTAALKGLQDLQKERDDAAKAAQDQANAGNGAGSGGGAGGEEAQPSESPPADSGGGGSGGGGSGGGGQGGGQGGGGAGGATIPTASIQSGGVGGGPIPQNDMGFKGGGLGSALSAGLKFVADALKPFVGKFTPQKAADGTGAVEKTKGADRELASMGISKGGAGGGAGGGATFDPAVNNPPGDGRGMTGGPGGSNSPLGGDLGAGLGGGYEGSASKNPTVEVAFGSSGSVDGGGDMTPKAPKEPEVGALVGGAMKASAQREVSSTKGEPGAIFGKMKDTLGKMRQEKKLLPSRFERTV